MTRFLFLGRCPMEKNKVEYETQNHDETIEASNRPSEKIRHGAPSGPRKKRRDAYDGREALPYAGHEGVAQFLAAPTSLRKFKSLRALAAHFKVTRMTAYRWGHDPDVIQRAHFLSEINQMAGDLLARQEWSRIMQTAVRKAIEGDLQSIKFCESRAYPKALRLEQRQLSATVSIQDLLGTTENDGVEELPDKNGQEEGGGE
jgi:hypothetical protein